MYTHRPSVFSNLTKVISVLSVMTLALLSGQVSQALMAQQYRVLAASDIQAQPTFSARTTQSVASQQILPLAQIKQEEIIARRALPTPTPVPSTAASDWGIATKIGDHTWTVKLGNDDRMATPQEILAALNTYRQRYGRGTLSWDPKLAAYAQSRADSFTAAGQTDKHAGFMDFVNNQHGFDQLGYNGLGENSSFGYQLLGVHIIEWMYAADSEHNDNQLNAEWTAVGIGVSGVATDLVFGGKKF